MLRVCSLLFARLTQIIVEARPALIALPSSRHHITTIALNTVVDTSVQVMMWIRYVPVKHKDTDI